MLSKYNFLAIIWLNLLFVMRNYCNPFILIIEKDCGLYLFVVTKFNLIFDTFVKLEIKISYSKMSPDYFYLTILVST